MICAYDDAGNVIETHEHKGEFKEWYVFAKPAETLRHLRLPELVTC
jgi:hypothetical protein